MSDTMSHTMTDTIPTDAQEKLVDDALADLLRDHDPKTEEHIEFRGHQYDHGLAWVHFPRTTAGSVSDPSSRGR